MLETIPIEAITAIAQKAGDAIMEVYDKDFHIAYKEDTSPLTEADTLSNRIICSALEAQFPDIPLLSEENKEVPYETRKTWEYYWCIDPIDGTKEFIKKNGEFTVNIALIRKDTPVLGVVYAPALKEMYYAKEGEGAFKARVWDSGFRVPKEEDIQALPIEENRKGAEGLRIVASKSHLNDETKAFINNLTSNIQHPTFLSRGSSLKLVMVAEGSADIYPRLAPTMEWDTAAADAIVRESGKMVYQYHTTSNIQHPTSLIPVVYNKEDLLNPWFIVQERKEPR